MRETRCVCSIGRLVHGRDTAGYKRHTNYHTAYSISTVRPVSPLTHTGCGLTEREKLRGDSEHSRHHNSRRLTEREKPRGDSEHSRHHNSRRLTEREKLRGAGRRQHK